MSDKCVFFIKYVSVKVKVCFVEFGGTSGTLNEKSRGGLMVNVVRRRSLGQTQGTAGPRVLAAGIMVNVVPREVPRPNPRGRRPRGFWPQDLARHNIHHDISKAFS